MNKTRAAVIKRPTLPLFIFIAATIALAIAANIETAYETENASLELQN